MNFFNNSYIKNFLTIKNDEKSTNIDVNGNFFEEITFESFVTATKTELYLKNNVDIKI